MGYLIVTIIGHLVLNIGAGVKVFGQKISISQNYGHEYSTVVSFFRTRCVICILDNLNKLTSVSLKRR